MKKEHSQFLIVFLVLAVLTQAWIVIFSDPAASALANDDAKDPALQGKIRYETTSGAGSTRIQPENIAELPVVEGYKPGEGRGYPTIARNLVRTHPLLDAFDNKKIRFSLNDSREQYRLLIYSALLLEESESHRLTPAQAKKIDRILEHKKEIDHTIRKAKKGILAALTPKQKQYIKTRWVLRKTDKYPVPDTDSLAWLLSDNIKRKNIVGKKDARRYKLTRFQKKQADAIPWTLRIALWGVLTCRQSKDFSLSQNQLNAISRHTGDLTGVMKKLESSNDAAGSLFTKRQGEYLVKCLSDWYYMSVFEKSYRAGNYTPAILGVNLAMYHSCRKKVDKKKSLE